MLGGFPLVYDRAFPNLQTERIVQCVSSMLRRTTLTPCYSANDPFMPRVDVTIPFVSYAP